MKYLKRDVNLNEFVSTVKQCSSDVLFQTEDGDSLNLKSVLSCYLFSMISSNQNYILSGRVICHAEEDNDLLANYVYEG